MSARVTISTLTSTPLSSGALRLSNLLNDFQRLRRLLLRQLDCLIQTVAEPSREPAAMADAPHTTDTFRLREVHALDAFLLAAGMSQVLDDYLHRDVHALRAEYPLSKVAQYVGGRPFAIARCAAACLNYAHSAMQLVRGCGPAERALVESSFALHALVEDLAAQLASHHDLRSDPSATEEHVERNSPIWSDPHFSGLFSHHAHEVLALLERAPAQVQRSVVRLPSCFRAFDLRPADYFRLTRLFAARWPQRNIPVLVVGIRTSGSYLAPLVAARLRMLGYGHVRVMTMRPGQTWLAHERDMLHAPMREGGRVVLVDDPPLTGGAMSEAARGLERCGVHKDSITCLLPLFGSPDTLPDGLRQYDVVCLPWSDWAIHEQLAPAAVRVALEELLSGREIDVSSSGGTCESITVDAVEHVERMPLEPALTDLSGAAASRRHVRAHYRVRVIDRLSNKPYLHDVYVKGTGLGYFGEHSMAVGQALTHFLPEIYGRHETLLYRAWLPSCQRFTANAARLAPDELDQAASRMATYIAERSQRLPADEDITPRLMGRYPVWENGGILLLGAAGHAGPLLLPVLYRVARYLLLPGGTRPSIIDGSTSPAHWFTLDRWATTHSGEVGDVRKVNFDEHAFSNRDMTCYDAGFDAALAAAYAEVETGDAWFAQRVRRHYERLTGTTITDERWLLYQLIALLGEKYRLRGEVREPANQELPTDMRASSAVSGDGCEAGCSLQCAQAIPSRQAYVQLLEAVDRQCVRLHQRYIGQQFLADVAPAHAGPLCAIDLDGVLETSELSYNTVTPAGALALRALIRHGYRPLLATGRSIDDVRERCQAYRLAGGVAEYGAVVYNHLNGQTNLLLSSTQCAVLAELRAALADMEGVFLDPHYHYAIRAYRFDKSGDRCGLTEDLLETALARIGQNAPNDTCITPIRGAHQTDFMASAINKGAGLRRLAELLGVLADPSRPTVLAFAMGDTASDLSMLALADRAFVPANADAVVREHVRQHGRLPGTSLRITRRPGQQGLLQAVSELLGHAPGRCPTCRPPRMSVSANLLVTALAVEDEDIWGKLKQGVILNRTLNKATRSQRPRERI